jgi:hypothetical protein
MSKVMDYVHQSVGTRAKLLTINKEAMAILNTQSTPGL